MHTCVHFAFRDILLLEVGFLSVLVAPFKLTLLDTFPKYVPALLGVNNEISTAMNNRAHYNLDCRRYGLIYISKK